MGTKPFQIPLGALVPKQLDNLLAASKDIGTTHITNGAYRLHPVEWAIGEAPGALASFALQHRVMPAQVDSSARLTGELQLRLLAHGVPIYWFDDLPSDGPLFRAAQYLAARGIFGPNRNNLHFNPEVPVKLGDAALALRQVLDRGFGANKAEGRPQEPSSGNTTEAVRWLVQRGYFPSSVLRPGLLIRPVTEQDLQMASRRTKIFLTPRTRALLPVTRAQFAFWLDNVYLSRIARPVAALGQRGEIPQ